MILTVIVLYFQVSFQVALAQVNVLIDTIVKK